MSDFEKNRVLALYKILTAYTDEQHQISMQDILVHMDAEGYYCSEDSILRYIKQLRNELGGRCNFRSWKECSLFHWKQTFGKGRDETYY